MPAAADLLIDPRMYVCGLYYLCVMRWLPGGDPRWRASLCPLPSAWSAAVRGHTCVKQGEVRPAEREAQAGAQAAERAERAERRQAAERPQLRGQRLVISQEKTRRRSRRRRRWDFCDTVDTGWEFELRGDRSGSERNGTERKRPMWAAERTGKTRLMDEIQKDTERSYNF